MIHAPIRTCFQALRHAKEKTHGSKRKINSSTSHSPTRWPGQCTSALSTLPKIVSSTKKAKRAPVIHPPSLLTLLQMEGE